MKSLMVLTCVPRGPRQSSRPKKHDCKTCAGKICVGRCRFTRD